MRPETTLEKDIEKKLRTAVEQKGGRCLKWVCPGWGGVPDRIVLLPGARIYFVEMKRPKGGRVSPLQKKWREWLTALGFEVWTIWDETGLYLFRLNVLNERNMQHETDKDNRLPPRQDREVRRQSERGDR